MNNTFFNNFLKKDKFYHTTQNNPIYKKIYHQPKYVDETRINFARSNMANIDNTRGYNSRIAYYPPGRKNTRLPIGGAITNYNVMKYHIENPKNIKQLIRKHIGVRPAPMRVLPPPINVQNTIENQKALLSVGRFNLITFTKDKPSDYQTNYWYPDYQGTFTNLASKNSIQPKTPFHMNTNFVPKKYLNDKQKEGFVWLDFGNYSYHKNRLPPNRLGYP